MLMSTMKSVTRRAILPGTTSGLMVNDTQETTTNMRLGRYTWIIYCIRLRTSWIWKPHAAYVPEKKTEIESYLFS